jgi:hypothetical protein
MTAYGTDSAPATRRLPRALGVLAAGTALIAGLVTSADSTTAPHSHSAAARAAATGGQANDRNATRGISEGPVSATPKGLPPQQGRAKRHAGPNERAPRPATAQGAEGVENGEGQNAYSTRLLTWHSGPVQTAPRIYLVLWGPSWSTNGDPYGVANRLHYFYGGVGGSSVANVLKQYSGSTGAFTNPTGQYAGWLSGTTAVPAYPAKADVAAAAARAAARVNNYSYNAQYVIATPWGVVDQYSTQNRFCAWHNWTLAGPSGSWVTYTSLPYTPYLDYIGRGCGGTKVNGSNGVLDGVTINASHEYAETVNDPGLNAWLDVDNSENADKCSWINLANKTLTNGYVFPVQPSWSNTWKTQNGYGCYYSS